MNIVLVNKISENEVAEFCFKNEQNYFVGWNVENINDTE